MENSLGLLSWLAVGFLLKTIAVTHEEENMGQDSLYRPCIVKRQAGKNGFHREITTSISVHRDELQFINNSSGYIVLKEIIPGGMFVDLYQTKAEEKFNGPEVYSSVDIDVENPEYLSPSHEVLVYTKLQNSGDIFYTQIVLPIHLRYHKPQIDEVFTNVKLEVPDVLLKITENNLRDTGHQYESFPCDSTNISVCSWQKISCIYEPDDGVLLFAVPVGNKSHLVLVTIVTLAVTAMGTIFLCVSIKSKHDKIIKTKLK